MSEALIYHQNGWGCTVNAEAKQSVYKDGDNFKRRQIAILQDTFFVGAIIDNGVEVDLLIKDGQKHYSGVVDGINKKNGSVKIILTNGGDNTNYKTVLNKIKTWQQEQS